MKYFNQYGQEIKIFDISCKDVYEFIKKYFYDPSNEVLAWHSMIMLKSEIERYGWCHLPQIKNNVGEHIGYIERRMKNDAIRR